MWTVRLVSGPLPASNLLGGVDVRLWWTWCSDPGNPFGPGRRITNDTIDELSLASNPANGFLIVVAIHIDAAEQLLEGCPTVDSVTLYEAPAPEGGHNT